MNLLSIIWDFDPTIFSIGSFSLRYYSLCWVLAFVFGYIVALNIFKKKGIQRAELDTLLVYVMLGAMLGARLGHCLFYDFEYYSKHIHEIILPFRIVDGKLLLTGYAGLASHGGAIGLLISIYIYSKKNKRSFLSTLDILGIVAPLGGAFIRLGNFFNSEIIGKPSDSIFAIVFKKVDNIPRHPSQLYEALFYFIIFVIIFFIYINNKKCKFKNGFFFGLSIFLIFVVRFLLEYTKEVQEPFEYSMVESIGMNMGQLLSLPFMIVGLIMMYFKMKQTR